MTSESFYDQKTKHLIFARFVIGLFVYYEYAIKDPAFFD